MTTEKTTEHAVRNYTVLSLQKKILARSNISFMLVNKEYINKTDGISRYNRVAALDFNLAKITNGLARHSTTGLFNPVTPIDNMHRALLSDTAKAIFLSAWIRQPLVKTIWQKQAMYVAATISH